ncbi:MAG: hypothetical protein ACJAUY_000650 [Cognaticolwellia sp.]|jgi:hypothetical protein
MSYGNLKVDVAENGFIVYEQSHDHARIGKQWAFEGAESLAYFIRDWGQGKTKTTNKAENANKTT